VEAKLIDFQMSRYAPPVLDIVHYLFACTEKRLRDEHFPDFMDAYYNTMDQKLKSCNLSLEGIYPRSVFNRQLQQFPGKTSTEILNDLLAEHNWIDEVQLEITYKCY